MCETRLELFPLTSSPNPVGIHFPIHPWFTSTGNSPARLPAITRAPGLCWEAAAGSALLPGGAGFWAWEGGRGGRAPRRCGKLAIRHGKKGAVPNPWAPLQLFKASTPVVRERRGEGGELQFPGRWGKARGGILYEGRGADGLKSPE